MDKIVKSGLKLDLHIHSCVSRNKDGKKVKNNTIENIPVLVKKLDENGVNMCAITDHDLFSFDMYSELKNYENKDYSIRKVFPGVEFSVNFRTDLDCKTIHVVAIFSDENDSKIKKIETVLNNNRPNENGAYSEESFLNVLRNIDLDTILIAHQKTSLSSSLTRDNDANSLGEKKFFEFIYTDYFEAFEYKNKRNEIFNKSFLNQHDVMEKVSFVTGTDCHDWTSYPQETPNDKTTDFPYTYAKCLPTFKGLVMAMTDHTRLKRVNSFFSQSDKFFDNLILEIDDKTVTIPFSQGINVIIGDNSVGKSALLHAITKYFKLDDMTTLKKGYKNYFKNENIKIKQVITKRDLFCFDMQGEVKNKFDENKLKADAFFKDYFPPDIDIKQYETIIISEIEKLKQYLTTKFELDKRISELNQFPIEFVNDTPKSLHFSNYLRNSKVKTIHLDNIQETLNDIINKLKETYTLELDETDSQFINEVVEKLSSINAKYLSRKNELINENNRKEKIATIIGKVSTEHNKTISDDSKRRNKFSTSSEHTIQEIVEIIKGFRDLITYTPNIEEVVITPKTNKVFKYEFVTKTQIEKINTKYIISLINSPIKKDCCLDLKTVTEEELESILRYKDNSKWVVTDFIEKIKEQVKQDLSQRHNIIKDGVDRYAELSAGFNSKIYFDLISHEPTKTGIYIIDQPEDNVSQTSISENLIDYFKEMSENHQIIMVTHNPQFIVNLDIDNLIYISKDSKGIKFQSGALEYSCEDYNILDIVATNIDGGLDSIHKRWKRYEKASNIY